MQSALRAEVRTRRVGFDGKLTYVDMPPIDHDLSNPCIAAFVKGDAKVTAGFVVASGAALVLKIYSRARVTQVRESVIRALPVEVVNPRSRPRSVCVQPRKSVRRVVAPINHDLQIASIHWATGNISNLDSVRRAGNPCKYASARPVVEQFTQTLRRKIGLSHDAVPSLIGQRPATISRRVRASLFYWFGSSSGSHGKDATIKQALEKMP